MMTDSLSVSVVAAPLAAIDSRALSQAWFSALHLARERTTRNHQPNAALPETEQHGATSTKTRTASSSEPRRTMLPCRAYGGAAIRGGTNEAPGHRVRAPLAREVKFDAARRPKPPARAAFVVVDGSKRALVVIQTRGAATHVVAICSPAHRQAVAVALSEVHASLAVRGIALQSRVEANAACS
jgi:hypothetical protein